MMHRDRATKIVATLGPASSSEAVIEQLFLKGVDIFRLNYSHGNHEIHANNIAIIRALEQKHSRPIAILQDLQGPKLRIGRFESGPIILKNGDSFSLAQSHDLGNQHQISFPYPEILQKCNVGDILLLDDGKIKLEVTKCLDQIVTTKVIVGGKLSDNKGVNLPNQSLPLAAMTEKDIQDLHHGLAHNVDWVALSFVQRASDMEQARNLVGNKAGLIAKIEKPQAVDSFAEILQHSDAIMLARGDLGVEMSPEDVPSTQKQIVHQCRQAGKPVIIATQMLESMIQTPRPTRAEASDVATAVYEGADAVTLSAESAMGEYPEEAVEIMSRIIKRVEKDPIFQSLLVQPEQKNPPSRSDAITAAARLVAEDLHASAIVTITFSGDTALRASRSRPLVPIISLTPSMSIARRLNLVWNIHPRASHELLEIDSISDMLNTIQMILLKEEFVRSGDEIILTAGSGFTGPAPHKVFCQGTTTTLRILTVGEQYS